MASAVIGALRVQLGIDSAQFQTGIKNTQSGLEKFAKQAAMVAAAVSAAIGGISIAIRGAAQRANEMKNLSLVAGADLQEFQRLAHGAQAVGIQSEKLADIYKDVNDKLGDFFQTGAGPMADFFENIAPKVGLTADAFRNLSGPQALQAYYDALEKAGVSQAEMTFYMEAIASDVTALAPLLRDGGKAFKEFGDQAERMGLVIDDKTAAASKRFTDNLTVLSATMTGFWNRVLTGVIGAFSNLTDRIVEASLNSNILNGVVAAITTSMNLLARGIGFVLDNLHHLIDLFKVFVAAKIITYVAAIGGAMLTMARTVRVAGVAMALLTSITRVKITTIALLAAVVAKLTGTYDGMVGWLRDTGNAIMEALPEGMRTGIDGLGQSLKDLIGDINAADGAAASSFGTYLGIANEAIGSFGAAGEAAKSAADKIKEMQAEGARIFEATRTPLEQYQATIARLNELLAAGAINQDTYNRAVLQAQDAFAHAEKAGKKTENVFVSIGQTIAQSFGSAISGIIDGSKKAGEVITDLASQLGNLLVNQAFQSLIGFIFPGASGGISLHNLPGNANGTNSWRGGLTAINERGGEIIDLPKGSRVIPHDVSMAMARNSGGSSYQDNRVFKIDARGAQQGVGEEIKRALIEYDREVLPARVSAIANDPHARG